MQQMSRTEYFNFIWWERAGSEEVQVMC